MCYYGGEQTFVAGEVDDALANWSDRVRGWLRGYHGAAPGRLGVGSRWAGGRQFSLAARAPEQPPSLVVRLVARPLGCRHGPAGDDGNPTIEQIRDDDLMQAHRCLENHSPQEIGRR